MSRSAKLVALVLALSASAAASHAAWTSSKTNTIALTAAADFRPTATGAPNVSGTVAVGETLTASVGGVTWRSEIATTTAYQWESCLAGVCTPILGATSLTHLLDAVPLGTTFRFAYSATNAYGTNTVYSATVS